MAELANNRLADRGQDLDELLDRLAVDGLASIGVDLSGLDRGDEDLRDWMAVAYERTLERRTVRLPSLVTPSIAEGDVEASVGALLSSVLDADRPNPLFSASLDLFFAARGDRVLRERLRAIRENWDPALITSMAGLFTPGTPEQVRVFVAVHLEALGFIAVSNGFTVFDVFDGETEILRALLRGDFPIDCL